MPGTVAEIVFDHVTKRYAGREQAAVNDLSRRACAFHLSAPTYPTL